MKTLFDKLEDETPPTIGEEIGAALSGPITELGKQNERLANMLADAMTKAIAKVESKKIVIEEKKEEKRITNWEFTVERDARGFATKIIANGK